MRIAALAFLIVTSSPAAGQTIKPLVDSYNKCVLTVSVGIAGNRQEAAERSFFACQTEEQALRVSLALTGLPPANIEAAIIQRKLALKRTILHDPQ